MIILVGGLLILSLASVAGAVASHRASTRAQADLERLARFDVLTGLPDRHQLAEALGRIARPRQGAVLLLELRRFDAINDTYGPEVGDGLLIAVSDLLGRMLEPGEQLFRMVGPQYAVLLPDAIDTRTAERRARVLVSALDPPFRIGTDLVPVSVSVGVSLLTGAAAVDAALAGAGAPSPVAVAVAVADNDTAVGAGHAGDESRSDVLHQATVALRRAERSGPGTVTVFDGSMQALMSPTGAAERLRQALDADEFWPLYLPVVAVDDQELVGVEALLRWADPDQGLVSPDQFLPLLEESGLIVPVGERILEQVCRQSAAWHQAFPHRNLLVTVNVSPSQLARADFIDRVLAIIDETGADPASICLEITEGMVGPDLNTSWGMLRKAKDAGVKLALDDFGTGYSSMINLRRFSLDVLKIDRTFVSGIADHPGDAAIAQQLVALAHALDIAPVAEGVDSAAQLRTLHGMGCDFAQGYYFSSPQPVTAIDAMLAKGSVKPADTARGIDWSGGEV